MQAAPILKNEMARIMELADLNLDYANLNDAFKDLTMLAAKVSGSPISLVNIIDNYTVWTVARYGMEVYQTPREESICQYTINEKDAFAVNDLDVHPLFKDEDFVTGEANLKFYYGVPLTSQEQNLGALCVMDRQAKTLQPEKIELLKIIAREIISRIKTYQYIESLREKVNEVKQTQNRVVHDIRGPIAGIIGVAEIISMQGDENKLEEVLELIGMIQKGGRSVLDLADEILTEEKRSRNKVKANELTLYTFKQKLEQLYAPQATSKNIMLKVVTADTKEGAIFAQNKLMQIAGNLISNAIKFTPKWGTVTVTLTAEQNEKEVLLKIQVQDTGEGIDEAQIAALLGDNTASTQGTAGEKGYGFGLELAKHLVKGLNGTFNITSTKGEGAAFEVSIPFKIG